MPTTTESTAVPTGDPRTTLASARPAPSKGLLTVAVATVLLFAVSALVAPSSTGATSLRTMIAIASVLAVAGLGQMLVVQQGGIDLSVAGAISLAVIVVTHVPNGDDGMLVPAVLLALVLAAVTGVVNGVLVGALGLNAIIATLGTNALLYAVVLGLSGGRPRTTTDLLASVTGGRTAGVPHSVFFAIGALVVVTVLVRRTVAGRRFEAVGANPRAARAIGLRVVVHQGAAYVWAQLLYCTAGIVLAGITTQPSAFEGDSFLLVSVAVVVLGGTSLLGGRGYPLATVLAAVFLQQLVQFVVALGVSTAAQIIVQAAALAIGVSLYTVDWRGLLARTRRPLRPTRPAAPPCPSALPGRRTPGPDTVVVPSGRNPMNVLRSVRSASVLTASITAALVLAGCGGSSSGGTDADAGAAPTSVEGAPSWCGPKEISLALLDGFGGNSWRLTTTASGEDEAKKCPSVTDFKYADGQGDTQKAIADIKGFASTGVDAMVVFPDAGKAVLPALTQAYKAGVVVVPYRVDPGGEAGVNYDQWIGYDFTTDAENWATWIQANVPDGGNILFMGGPAGNSQSTTEYDTLRAALPDSYQFVGQTPFVPTDWDPTTTQTLLAAAISQNPQIDVIVSDFGPTLVSSLGLFPESGRPIPALATTDGNSLSCFWEDSQAENPFKMETVTTGNDNVRLAVQYAVAKATGGVLPTETEFAGPVFEDSVTGTPNPVTCDKDLPPDVYLSAELSGEAQAALGQ